MNITSLSTSLKMTPLIGYAIVWCTGYCLQGKESATYSKGTQSVAATQTPLPMTLKKSACPDSSWGGAHQMGTHHMQLATSAHATLDNMPYPSLYKSVALHKVNRLLKTVLPAKSIHLRSRMLHVC
jgi:hypothetical protein